MKHLLQIICCVLFCSLSFSANAQDVEPRAVPNGFVTIEAKNLPGSDTGIVSGKYQLDSKGTVQMPYLSGTISLSGKTGRQIQNALTEAYKKEKIYTSPVFSVVVDSIEHQGVGVRYVHVTGFVGSKKNLPYRPELTLIEALIECGDITDFGSRYILVTRSGVTKQYDYFSTRDRGVKLFPGDVIFVKERGFTEGREKTLLP